MLFVPYMTRKGYLCTMESTFTSTLLTWYERHARELPWRGIDDAYGIWLSEIILQQTRVQQGRDYWLRFMRRFPRVEELAAASEDEVLRLWQGLGYYSRARNITQNTTMIIPEHNIPAFKPAKVFFNAVKGE